MSDDDILYEVEDEIATITLNRPQAMNALTPAMEAEMHALFDKADADRGVRVIILTGAGAAFSSGYDQGAGDSGRKKTDPTGLSIADFVETWQRGDAKHAEKWGHM